MPRSVEKLLAVAICATFVVSLLGLLPLSAQLDIYRNRDNYKAEKFVVTKAVYHEASDQQTDIETYWWLTGTVAGQKERLVPFVPEKPQSADDLLKQYPIGSTLDVFFNPALDRKLIQSTSLRVQIATPNYWEEQRWRLIRLAILVFVPPPVAIALYCAVRFANSRSASPRPIPTKMESST
jgi:hypothetical protein